ncbi:hypothetical protein ACX3U9_10205 [Corynebacterium pyruviciproducens]|uniref:hypothetical protein n=1 Tax=Corynebacterium pyruviciproducens TaxID=598660 RepID=UPI0039833810
MKRHLAACAAALAVVFGPVAGPAVQPAIPAVASAAEDVQIDKLSQDGATLEVPHRIDPGKEFTLKGTGWKAEDGTHGSTVTLKISVEKNGVPDFFQRTDDIITHPNSGKEDKTMWAMVKADDDGVFTITTTAPSELEAGTKVRLHATSGLVTGDAHRSLTSDPLAVEGVEVKEEATEKIVCTPSVPQATLSVPSSAKPGSVIHVSGRGFCNLNSGASVVVLKYDRGQYARAAEPIYLNNATIAAVVDPDPHTGDFEYELQLPDGTEEGTNGTKPVFPEGEHTIVALTGSIKPGDPQRSVRTESFTVGEYKPVGIPDALHYDEDLTKKTDGDVEVYEVKDSAGKQILEVSVPGAADNSWVYINAYNHSGTPIVPWGDTWLQVKNEKVSVPLEGVNLPADLYKITVQSGDQGEAGKLRGWDYYVVEEGAATKPTQPKDKKTTSTTATTTPSASTDDILKDIQSFEKNLEGINGSIDELRSLNESAEPEPEETSNSNQEGTGSAPTTTTKRVITRRTVGTDSGQEPTPRSSGTSHHTGGSTAKATANKKKNFPPKPESDPKAPKRWQLSPATEGKAQGSLDNELLTITLPNKEEGDWVYLFIYAGDEAIPVGWTQVTGDKTVKLETKSIPNGEYKVGVVNEKGEVEGWLSLGLGPEKSGDSDPSSGTVGSNSNGGGNPNSEPKIENASLMSATDWWLILGGVAIPLIYALGLRGLARRR